MKLYKYTDSDIGCKIIESSSISLSKPEAFNDPFDCKPISNDIDLQNAIDVINGYIIEQQIFKSMLEFKDKLKNPFQKLLVSFVIWEYRVVQGLYNKSPSPYKPFLTFKRFEKMFDFCVKLGKISSEQQRIVDAMKYAQEQLEKRERDIFNDMLNMRDTLHIACLSEVYNSILMWSYYADKHKGLCIEFDIDEPQALEKVKYCNERPNAHLEDIIKDFCGKLFAQGITFEKNYDLVLSELVLKPYITKSSDWSHEKEQRLIFPEEVLVDRKYEKKKCDDGVERYFYNVKITKVFLGAAMSEEMKAEIRAIIPADIEVVEMKISDNKYELLS